MWTSLCAVRGIVESKNRSLLQEYGGNITIDRSWAKSLLMRMNFVKRRVAMVLFLRWS